MNRISFDRGRNRGELRHAIIAAINFEIGELTRRLEVHRRQIYEVALVGNTTMRDLAFGLDVQPIGVKPYKSKVELEYEEGQRAGDGAGIQCSGDGTAGVSEGPASTEGPIIGCHVGGGCRRRAACGWEWMSRTTRSCWWTSAPTPRWSSATAMAWSPASCPAGPAFEGGGGDSRYAGLRWRSGSPFASGTAGLRPAPSAAWRPRAYAVPAWWTCWPNYEAHGLMNGLGSFSRRAAGNSPLRPDQGHGAVAGRHQRIGSGKGRQLLRTVHHLATLWIAAGRDFTPLPGRRIR